MSLQNPAQKSQKEILDKIGGFLNPVEERELTHLRNSIARIARQASDIRRQVQDEITQERLAQVGRVRQQYLTRLERLQKQRYNGLIKKVLLVGGLGVGAKTLIEYLADDTRKKPYALGFIYNYFTSPEKHPPGQNYNGKGTDLRNRLAITYPGNVGTPTYHIPSDIGDYMAFKHDIGYSSANQKDQALFDRLFNYEYDNLENTLQQMSKRGLINGVSIKSVINNPKVIDKLSQYAIYFKSNFIETS